MLILIKGCAEPRLTRSLLGGSKEGFKEKAWQLVLMCLRLTPEPPLVATGTYKCKINQMIEVSTAAAVRQVISGRVNWAHISRWSLV